MTLELKKKFIFWGSLCGVFILFIIIIACMGASITSKNKKIDNLTERLTIVERELKASNDQKIIEEKIDKEFNKEIKDKEVELNEEDKLFYNNYFKLFNNYVIKLPKSNL